MPKNPSWEIRELLKVQPQWALNLDSLILKSSTLPGNKGKSGGRAIFSFFHTIFSSRGHVQKGIRPAPACLFLHSSLSIAGRLVTLGLHSALCTLSPMFSNGIEVRDTSVHPACESETRGGEAYIIVPWLFCLSTFPSQRPTRCHVGQLRLW